MNLVRAQEATLIERNEVAEEAYEIALALERPVGFVPGQYAWIILPHLSYADLRGNRRPFTICSSPLQKQVLRFLFRRHNPSSGYKKTLLELPLQSHLGIEVPFGTHTLPPEPAPLCLVAGGVGISSFISALRDMDERNAWRPTELIYGRCFGNFAPYLEELRAYAKRHSEFTLREVEGPILRAHLPIRRGASANWLLSGPQAMIGAIAPLLGHEGIDASRIAYEEYAPSLPAGDSTLSGIDIYKLAVESASDHMVFTDPEGIILYCNRAAERITGYTLQEMRGSTPRLWGGLMDKEFYEHLWRTIKLERNPFSDIIKNRRKNGEVYTVIARISPVTAKNGTLLGFLGTEVDITEHERASEERRIQARQAEAHARELQRVNRRLSREDRLKNEFIATLAHELRNPLAPIASSLELLRIEVEKLARPDLLCLIDTARKHNQTLAYLLDDLLDIARISRKNYKLQKESVDLASLVGGARESIERLFESKRHTLLVSLPQESVELEVDPLRFEQVLVTMLNNAATYTDPGGRIELAARYNKNEGLHITVMDSGKGIAPPMLDKIFEPFVRGHGNSGAGLGIGLALAKRLVKLHGGRIWAESAGPGEGSTFGVSLPPRAVQLRLLESPGRRRGALSPREKSQDPRTILVVDDNKDAADGLSALLRHFGHNVAVAYDGESAIAQMHHAPAEIVLLDIGMPGMDGYTVARKLRQEHFPRLPTLIALTGYGQEEDKRKALETGFNYHLTKPVGVADIQAILARQR